MKTTTTMQVPTGKTSFQRQYLRRAIVWWTQYRQASPPKAQGKTMMPNQNFQIQQQYQLPQLRLQLQVQRRPRPQRPRQQQPLKIPGQYNTTKNLHRHHRHSDHEAGLRHHHLPPTRRHGRPSSPTAVNPPRPKPLQQQPKPCSIASAPSRRPSLNQSCRWRALLSQAHNVSPILLRQTKM